jgi:predicted DNA-binding transcriptional regulator YafY
VGRNDQIIRILSVAGALAASRRGVSLKALAAREGWSWRTVYRDVEALQAAGFPVEGKEGRFWMRSDWAPPNLPGVEPDEIAAFYSVRALVGSWRNTALGKPLDRLWAKLTAGAGRQGSLVPVSREPWLAVRSPLAIDYRAHDKTIATFERAVREHLVVSCRYRALSSGQMTARHLEPGDLYWDPGLESLYVIGWCRLRQDVRVFALQRFMAAALTDQRFTPRPEARSRAALKHAFRVWRDQNVTTVRVRFSPELAAEIRERTWSPDQRIEDAPDGLVLTMPVAGIAEVQRWILGFGGGAEVLEPEELRRNVEAGVSAAAARYAAGATAVATAKTTEIGVRRPPRKKPAHENRLPRDDKGLG